MSHGLLPGRDHPGIKQVALPDKFGNKAVHRLLIDILGRALLFNNPVVHHHHPVGKDQGLFLVMGDKDKGDAKLSVELPQLQAHLLSKLVVKGAQGFVQEQDQRFIDNGPGNGHPLLLGPRRGSESFVLPRPESFTRARVSSTRVLISPGWYFFELQPKGDIVKTPSYGEKGHSSEKRC